MNELEEIYFKTDTKWREWLSKNHNSYKGIQLIFYKVDHEKESMRCEVAVKVALCVGWIDATVTWLGNGKRWQYFCPRKQKSVWSAVNKQHIINLIDANLMHQKGLEAIEIAKQNGSWTTLDAVEKGIIPNDLQIAFDKNETAFTNYNNFAPSYRKCYLYWINQAKREATRQKRINEIM
jgi:uncharacterized protein YdeI (YjbR/CyaY-like superfamily)